MSEIRNYTCIVCPKGCDIKVEIENGQVVKVSGNACKRGEVYAKDEVTAPMRTLTTTAATSAGSVVPVRTDIAIPKHLLFDAVQEINKIVVPTEAKAGYVLIENLLSTGAKVYTVSDADRDE